MPLPDITAFVPGEAYIEPKKGLLGKAGTLLFDLADASANATRSAIRFGQTGDPEYLVNIAKSLTPFTKERRISGESITGDPYSGLAVEILADPLIFVNSFGGLTKAGKSYARVAELRAFKKVAEIAGKTDEVAKLSEQIAKEVTKLEKFKSVPRSGTGRIPKRSIVDVGLPFGPSKELGDVATFKRFLAQNTPWSLMPDTRIGPLKREARKLQKAIFKAEELGKAKKATELTAELDEVTKQLSGLKPYIVPASTARFIRNTRRSLVSKLDPRTKSKLLAAFKDMEQIGEAEESFKLRHITEPELGKAFEDIRKAEQVEEVVLKQRLLKMLEHRQFLPRTVTLPGGGTMTGTRGFTPNFEAIAIKEAQKVKKARIKKIETISKIPDPIERATQLEKYWSKFEDDLKAIKLKEYANRTKLGEYTKYFGKADPSEIAFIDMIASHTDDMIKRNQNLRIPISAYQASMTSYARHLLTPEAKAMKFKSRTKFSLLMNEAKTYLGAAYKRNKLYADMDIFEINKLFKEKHGLTFNFFDDDIIKVTVERMREDIVARNKAATALNIVEAFARTDLDPKKSIPVWSKKKPKYSFLGRVGLTGEAIGDLPAVDLKLRMPRHIVEDATKIDTLLQKSIFNDENVLKFFSALDHINAPFKTLLTVPFPRFHNRNMIGGWFNNMLAGIYSPTWYIKAAQIQHKRRLWMLNKYTPTKEELELFTDLEKYRILGRGMYFDLLRHTDETANTIKKWLKVDVDRPLTGTVNNMLESLGKSPMFSDMPNVMANPMVGRAYGEFIEDNQRIAHYLYKVEKEKKLPFEAMRSVNKHLFNYNDLTTFEKKIMRPTFLFYTWMRKNLPLQIASTMTNPRVLALYSKITNIGPDEAPDYLRAGSAFPVPGRDDLFVGSLGLPIEDLHMFNVDDVDPIFFEQIRRLGQKMIAKLSPALRIPLEVATGEQAFSRRPLRSMPLHKIATDILPISGFYRTAEKLIDPEKPEGAKLLDALTGIRTYGVSLTRAQIDELKRQAVATGKFTRQGFIVTAKEKYKEEEQVKNILSKMRKLTKKLEKEKTSK